MDKSIALIGGTGFIGTNLANYFLEKDYFVLLISRNLDTKNIIVKSDKLRAFAIDVNFTSKLIEPLKDYENIIWLVNDLLPSRSLDRLVDDFSFNIKPLIDFLEASNKFKKLKRFFYFSSGGTIYGDSPEHQSFKENSPKKPISAYGLSKIISENYIEFITRRSEFESFILRPSNIYGNFQNFKKPQGIVGYAFNAILNNIPIDLYGEGKVTRDFLHVSDLSEVILTFINNYHEKSRVEVYNIGSQKGYTINEILDLICKVTGRIVPTISKPARLYDCDYNVLDISKLRVNLEWEPKIEIAEGLNHVWNWIKTEQKFK